jgi:hypothetical protein
MMGSASEQYLKGIYGRFSYLATWLPNLPLQLGDVGTLQNDEFKQMTTLKDLGITFDICTSATPVDFTYTSDSGVRLITKLAGEAAAGTTLPVGEAGISMQFSNEGAFVFEAIGCTVAEIEDKTALGQAVFKLLGQKKWDSSWAVVDTVVRADSATIVVSNSANATLDLTAKTPITVASLAKVDAELSVNSQSGDVIRFVAARGLAPLFRLSRVKHSFLSGFLGTREFTFGGPTAATPAKAILAEDPFEAVTPE